MKSIAKFYKKNKFLCISVVLFFVLVIFLSLSTAYLSNNKNSNGNITIGDIDFVVKDNNVLNLVAMPNQSVKKQIIIKNVKENDETNYQNLCSLLLRLTPICYINDEITNQIIFLYSGDDWIKQNETYYYMGVVKKGEQINFNGELKFLETIDNMYQNAKVNIEILVEGLQAENNAYKEIWQDAPKSFVDAINQ